MRDNFPSKVKLILATRAGHRCSICEKLTSGPGAGCGLVINDGIAAHITGASPEGPRYDPSLSSEARKSESNGIWACTQDASEIDKVASTYSVETLRGLKIIREARAAKELHSKEVAESASGLLVEFPYVLTAYKLFQIIEPQPYNYATATALHDLLANSLSARVLELVPDVIISTWKDHPDVAGILATVLCNAIDLWHPTAKQMAKLDELCATAIESDNWALVASVEPLAFALAAQGRGAAHKKVLERIVSESKWRTRDVARVREYYGGVGEEVAALTRHWNDPRRKGLLQANDVGRLMDVILSSDRYLKGSSRRDSLLRFLLDHAETLQKCGAPEVAKTVSSFVQGIQLLRAKASGSGRNHAEQ
jgi:hypothetical protein